MHPAVDFQGISRAYKKDQPVLTGATFAVSPGEMVGLLGRNGSGKTTLIRIAMGLLRPHAGTVRVFGLSPTDDPVEVKSRVGYVAEEQVLPGGSSVEAIIRLYRWLYPKWDLNLELRLMKRFGISRTSTIATLSKGQARQVALICAIAHRPELLILDEPAGGLDPAARRELLETSIQSLNNYGTAILFSSHHMADVERLGGRVVLLEDGRVRLDESLTRLHDAVCLAVVTKKLSPDAAAIKAASGCLRVRPVEMDWHAVFRGTPESVGRELTGRLGGPVKCSRLDLEDLFVELLGEKR